MKDGINGLGLGLHRRQREANRMGKEWEVLRVGGRMGEGQRQLRGKGKGRRRRECRVGGEWRGKRVWGEGGRRRDKGERRVGEG